MLYCMWAIECICCLLTWINFGCLFKFTKSTNHNKTWLSQTKNGWECYFLFSLNKHGIIIMPMHRSTQIKCFWLHESCFVTQTYHQNSLITTLSQHYELQHVISTITQIHSKTTLLVLFTTISINKVHLVSRASSCFSCGHLSNYIIMMNQIKVNIQHSTFKSKLLINKLTASAC